MVLNMNVNYQNPVYLYFFKKNKGFDVKKVKKKHKIEITCVIKKNI